MAEALVDVELAQVTGGTHALAESLRACHRRHSIDIPLENQSWGNSLAHMYVRRDVSRGPPPPQQTLYPTITLQGNCGRHENERVGP